MANIVVLLDAVGATGPGPIVRMDINITRQGGSIPILLSGVITATVQLEGTIATDYDINKNLAVFEAISNAVWTADTADGLFTPFTHIRANVVSWTAGTITMKTLM